MTEYRTDKVHPHGYLPDYQRLAAELGPAAAVCEIGVERGYSLAMWQDLFPASPAIVGVDRRDEGVEEAHWPAGTHKVVAEQDDPRLPALVTAFAPGFDLIVDDCSHLGHLTRATHAMLWPLVNPGGFYVVEDWADPWMFPDWPRWPDVDPSTKGDELIDYVPELIAALNDGARTVTYTREGLVIIQKLAAS